MKKKKWSDLDAGERDNVIKAYRQKTGPEVAKQFGLDYLSVRNSLSRALPKAEHGGARPGSGNKKGEIAFCGECRKQIYPHFKCVCDNHTDIIRVDWE